MLVAAVYKYCTSSVVVLGLPQGEECEKYTRPHKLYARTSARSPVIDSVWRLKLLMQRVTFHLESREMGGAGGLELATRNTSACDVRSAPPKAAFEFVDRCYAMPRPQFNVLVFMAVGRRFFYVAARKCHMMLEAKLSLALAHYDNSEPMYRTQRWYRRVQYKLSVTTPEIKLRLARRLLVLQASVREQLLRRYSHVWISDEDVEFWAAASLHHFIIAARDLEAAIIQPSTRGSIHSFIHPQSLCQVRSTDFVEVMAPMLDTCAFMETVLILHKSDASDYGLDRVWCRYFAARRRWDLCNVCAIVETDRGGPSGTRGFTKRWDLRGSSSRNPKLGGTYSLGTALQDDSCMRQIFEKYESKCVMLGCRGRAEQRTYCNASQAVVTRPGFRVGPTCDAPGWPVYYAEHPDSKSQLSDDFSREGRWWWLGATGKDARPKPRGHMHFRLANRNPSKANNDFQRHWFRRGLSGEIRG